MPYNPPVIHPKLGHEKARHLAGLFCGETGIRTLATVSR